MAPCFWRSMARFDDLIHSRPRVRSKLDKRNRSPENNDQCTPKGLMPSTSNCHVSWLHIITFKLVDFRYPKNSWGGASIIDNHKRTGSNRSPPFLTWENEVTKHIDGFSRFVLKIQIHESFWAYSHVSPWKSISFTITQQSRKNLWIIYYHLLKSFLRTVLRFPFLPPFETVGGGRGTPYLQLFFTIVTWNETVNVNLILFTQLFHWLQCRRQKFWITGNG